MPDNKEHREALARAQLGDTISLGERLKSARTARALSIEQVARALHLPVSAIAALESDDFATVGAPVFVKGHLRSYAALLGLSGDDLIEAYRRIDPNIDEFKAVIEPGKRSVRRSNAPLWTFWAMVAVAGLAVGLYLLPGVPPTRAPDRPADQPQPATPPARPEPPADVAESVPGTLGAPDVSRAAPDGPATVGLDATGEDSEPDGAATAGLDAVSEEVEPDRAATVALEAGGEVAEPEQAEVSQPAGSPGVALIFEFVDESWVEISGGGRRLLFGLQEGGTRHEFRAEFPIEVFLGNADGVEIRVDGEPYRIPASSRRGNVARFELKVEPEV